MVMLYGKSDHNNLNTIVKGVKSLGRTGNIIKEIWAEFHRCHTLLSLGEGKYLGYITKFRMIAKLRFLL